MKSITRNTFVYLLVNFLVTVAYSMPHLILTVILLSKRLSLLQILIAQSACSIAIVPFGFPSGLIVDNYSRKNIYSLSKLFLIVMFLVVLFSNNFYLIFAAWFCYGVALALDSGTLDAYIINQLKIAHREDDLRKFLALNNRLEIVGFLLRSSLGGVLYLSIDINIYVLGIAFLVASILVMFFLFNGNLKNTTLEESHVSVLEQQITDSFIELRRQPRLGVILIFDFLTQIFFQTHFQLWQPFFLSKGVDTKYSPAFYIAFQIIALFSYSINIDGIKKYAGLTKFCPLIIFLPLTFPSKHLWVLFPACFIFIFVLYVVEFILNYYSNKMVSIDNISSLVSSKSTISRLGSVCLLCLLSLMVKVFDVEKVIAVSFMTSLFFLFLLVIIWLRKQPRLAK